MLILTPMSKKTFQDFSHESIARYAENITENVALNSGPIATASAIFKKILPAGQNTNGHKFYSICVGRISNVAGALWFHLDGNKETLFIYDIYISTTFQRSGLATATLKNIESYARKLGLKDIRLHVFSNNDPAKNLYLKAGFRFQESGMFKLL